MAKAQEDLADEQRRGQRGRRHGHRDRQRPGDIVGIRIAPEAIDPDDVEMLEDLILAAIKEATRSAQALQQQSIGGLTGGLGGGLGLPGL